MQRGVALRCSTNARLNGASIGSTRGAPQNSQGITRGRGARPRRWNSSCTSLPREHVERASRLEPAHLLGVERVARLDAVARPVRVAEDDGDGLSGREVLEAEDIDPVVLADLVVVRLVLERERE